jgi:hypothetical protein
MEATMKRPYVLVIVSLVAAGAAHAKPATDDPAAGPPAAVPAPGSASTSTEAARTIVVHVPPGSAGSNRPIELTAVIDAPLAETLLVHWRAVGEPGWHDLAFERSSAGGWYAELPGAQAPGVEYYIAGRTPEGAEVPHFATAAAPHLVRVDPTVDDRLAELDRQRLKGRRERLAIDVDGHNFGNRYGLLDRFIRAEASLTHLVGGSLYELVFGFGLVQGSTPVESMPGGANERHGARYGFSGVRVRFTPRVYGDARISLGVSHDGFSPGAAAGVTFGRPWRSNVSVGGELMQDLGPSVYVRLQWDTASPLLMAASVIRSDMPGAIIDENGLFLKYEVMLQAFDRTTLRGSLSFGSRDGPAHFGAGLGAALAF